MSDVPLIERAEKAEKWCGEEYEHCDLLEIIDELLAECKRRQAEGAYWRQKAIEERAKMLCAVGLSTKFKDLDEVTLIEEVTERHRQDAARVLESEMPDHIREATKMVEMTDERRVALETVADFIETVLEQLPPNDVLLKSKRLFRDMLTEAER